MRILGFEGSAATEPQIVLVFGSGLVGSSVEEALEINGRLLHKQHLPWTWPVPTKAQRRAVEKAFYSHLDERPLSRATIIWAAGRSGFGASEEDMDLEFCGFTGVLALARSLAQSCGKAKVHCIHVSSAGGLFEGQIACEHDTPPQPIRAYGHGKLQQEAALAEESELGYRLIVRPSSVFGYVPQGRFGLVSALLSAAIQHRDAMIFGGLSTQRDFIFAPDVGRYIAQNVFAAVPKNTDLEKVIIASGRPATVFEIIKTVEEVVGVPLYLKIDAQPDNALNNTFRLSALPSGFFPTPLRQGIEQTKSKMETYSFGN